MRAELGPSQVAPGAVLDLEGQAHRVVGSLAFDEDGVPWSEHCIEGPSGRHDWLSIRPRGGLTVVYWTPRNDLVGQPGARSLDMDGRTWALAASGSATYTAQGHTGTGRSGACDYVEYADEQGLLVFESFDGGVWEVSVGRWLDPARVRSYHRLAGD